MRSCERPRKRSASVAVPSSVSKRYSLSTRTQGSSCRIRVSSSPRRVTAFSPSRSCSLVASHSSRVPILWSIIVLSFLEWYECRSLHIRHEAGHRRRRDHDQGSKSDDRERQRHLDNRFRGQNFLDED